MSATATTRDWVETDMREGAIWALRLIAGRDPKDEAEIAHCLEVCKTPFDLRAYATKEKGGGAIAQSPPPIQLRPELSVDMRQGVIWAYRLLLNRNPPNDDAIRHQLIAHAGPDSLRHAFVSSDEYRMQPAHLNGEMRPPMLGVDDALDDATIIERFKPFATEVPPAGFFADFIGVRTRCAYLPPPYMAWSGTVGGPPGSANGPMHDLAEWAGTLRSVLEARDQIVVVELGAGWAPWLVGAALAARKLGIDRQTLIGVEGDQGHVEFAIQHFRDNGLDPDAHRLLHAVVGSKDGIASFPKHEDSSSIYGAEADYNAGNSSGEMVNVRCISLETLLDNVPSVDLLHCDIQGAEADVLSSARKIIDERLRRIVIGTHSRELEGALHALFVSMGWRLEHDSSCVMSQASSGQLVLAADGTQVWSNPKLSRPILK